MGARKTNQGQDQVPKSHKKERVLDQVFCIVTGRWILWHGPKLHAFFPKQYVLKSRKVYEYKVLEKYVYYLCNAVHGINRLLNPD